MTYNIRELRQSKHWSQKKLSEVSGVPQSTISEIEKGKREPAFRLMKRIAAALDISLDQIEEKEAES